MIKKIPPSRQQSALARWLEIISYCGVALGLIILATVCYYEIFAPVSLLPTVPRVADSAPDQDERGGSVLTPTDKDESPGKEEEPGVTRGNISQGDTAGALLQEWLSADDARALINACKDVYSLARLRAGQPYMIFREDGTVSRFEYEVDDTRRLVVSRTGNAWVAVLEVIRYDIVLEKVEGSIGSSMFETMSDIGESPVLAVRLADIFAWEINFIRDIQPGDSFTVLLEKRYRDGEFKGYGKLLTAEFVNKGSKFEAFLFKDSFANPAYFNAKGDSLKRAFLKAPLSFTRISSRFTMQRMHPILNQVRAHPAVDYAAPTGTPVKAVGSGSVTYCGWGTGAGNYISVKHAGGYETMYLHLSGFAKNLKKGGRVRQGEVIGYVGSTGYATGPHLDFRMKKNGQFVNPEKILSPRDESVSAASLTRFNADRDLFRLYREGKKALTDYTLEKDTLLP